MQTDSLIGYRLLRRLGAGERAETFLAIADDLPDAEPVVLKAPLPGTTDTSILIEAEALDRARGPHVVDLLDLATGPHGTQVLVLARLSGPSLAQLLASRGSIGVAEAITVLVPLHETLERLHRAGVAHGRVRADAVLFAEGGVPVLARFGAARLADAGRPEALLEQDDAVLADRRDFAALAARVLPIPALDAMVEGIDSVPWGGWPGLLFGLGMPEPVRLDAAAPARSEVAPRAIAPVPAPVETRALVEQLLASGPEVLRGRVGPVVARVAGGLARVRLRVWAVAGASVLALAVALLVIPVPDAGAPGSPASSPSPTSTGVVAAAPTPSPIDEDDPLAALVALLAERERCIRDRSVLCLDGVDQVGSSALAADQDLVRELQQGAEQQRIPVVTLDRLVLEERLGGSALVSLQDPADSEPASILLMKDEAGWRIRDYLTG